VIISLGFAAKVLYAWTNARPMKCRRTDWEYVGPVELHLRLRVYILFYCFYAYITTTLTY